jgi:exopolysaccharide biosynthesis protein
MKKSIIFLFIYFLSLNLVIFSQSQFDTLSIKQVAKGVYHYSIQEPNVPWTLNVLKIDLSETILKIEAGISRDKITGFEKTSAMSERYNSDGHHIVGAINGGFFDGNGQDVGMQIREGEIITQNNHWSAIGFSSENEPFIEVLSLNSKLLLKDNSHVKNINGINKTRETNYLILYNSYFGNTSGTNQYGSEILIEPISKPKINDTIKYVVVDKKSDQGSMALSKGKIVLSGHGTSKDFIDTSINIGDTISIIQTIAPAPEQVNTLLNGFPKIVKNGDNCAFSCYAEEGGSGTFASARHPRTAAGYSKDKQFLYFVVVDGRQPEISKGMSLSELADFLVNIGVYRAVNLDGGGSSAMVIRNKIVNSPSDAGGERSVSNSLMLVSLDSAKEFSQINLNTEYAKVFSNNNYQFSASGSDEYFNPISINNSNIQYSLSHSFGAITNNGLFTASAKLDSGYVLATYEGLIDSTFVLVNSIVKLEINPKVALSDTTNEMQFKLKTYDINGWDKNLSYDNYKWTSTNSSVGIIDSLGKFTGLSEGTTQIIVNWGDVADTATVKIEFNEGALLLNKFDDIDDWNMTGENIDTVESSIEITNDKFTEGNSSLKLNYDFTYQSGVQNWVYLNTDIPIKGIPLNFEMDVNANDYRHSIALIVSNYAGEEFAILTNKTPDIDEQFDSLTAILNNPIPLELSNLFYFPINLERIAVLLSSDRVNNTTDAGSIYFDNLRLNYSDPPVSVNLFNEPPTSFALFQNFPNPFNPTTIIRYSIPEIETNVSSTKNLSIHGLTTLKIYNILGQEIATLVNKTQTSGNYEVTFNASNLASGVYYYTLKTSSFIKSKKMILLR